MPAPEEFCKQNSSHRKLNFILGLIPLESPEREKVVSLSLHSFFRENIRLQLWRARLEKSHAHESNTQRTKTNAFVICDAPQFNKISSKTILLPPSAARVGYMARDAFQNFMSFSSIALVERQSQGDPRGNVLATFLATSWGVPRSGIDKTGTANACRRHSVSVKRRSSLKF